MPYLLYIQLSDGHNLLTILPFVLFYTLRMTGIFLVRGINLSLTSLGLLKISLLLGLAGSLIGIAGAYSSRFIVFQECCWDLVERCCHQVINQFAFS